MSLSSLMRRGAESAAQSNARQQAKAQKGSNAQYAVEGEELTSHIESFLMSSRNKILSLPTSTRRNCEIECRLGVIQQPFGHARRLFSCNSSNLVEER